MAATLENTGEKPTEKCGEKRGEVVRSGEKRGPGQPTKYKVTYNQQAYRHCLLGATDKDLAALFDTTERTINTWKHEYPKFLQSVKDGKDNADARVVEAMFKRAVGYEHPEDKIFCSKDGDITTVETIKHYPPDGPTCLNWLKNRQPEWWRDKREHELTGDLIVNIKN